MTQRVVWHRIAELEVVDAAVYLADDNPAAAVRFMEAVDETVPSLVEMP